jgi:hypothetical protein
MKKRATRKRLFTKKVYGLKVNYEPRLEDYAIPNDIPYVYSKTKKGKLRKNNKESPLEMGTYTATLETIDGDKYLSLGMNLYVPYDDTMESKGGKSNKNRRATRKKRQ